MKDIPSLSDDELAQLARTAVRALPDAPEPWQRAAIGLWKREAVASGLQAVVRRLAAVLTFDSWALAAPALGMRSVRSPMRHLLFSAQGRDIDLRIAPAVESYTVAGQILGPDEQGVVELSIDDSEGHSAHVSHLDALGEFSIQGVRGGTYVMTLRMGSDEIVLPAVKVGEPGD